MLLRTFDVRQCYKILLLEINVIDYIQEANIANEDSESSLVRS